MGLQTLYVKRGPTLLQGGPSDPGGAGGHGAALYAGVRGRSGWRARGSGGRVRLRNLRGARPDHDVRSSTTPSPIPHPALLQAKFNGMMGRLSSPRRCRRFELTDWLRARAPRRGASFVGLVTPGGRSWPFARLAGWRRHRGRFSISGFIAALIMGLHRQCMARASGAEKFDHMAAVTNFVIMPMTFLSGTFYTDREACPSRSARLLEVQPVLLSDRWLPLRLHRPRRGLARGSARST